MKVLHLTTSLDGGAGIAAKRLHESLLKNDIDSKMLVLKSKSLLKSDISIYKSERKIRRINKAINFVNKLTPLKYFRFLNHCKDVEGHFEIFTTSKTTFRVEKTKCFQEADIIHLHWVSNFINFTTFFKALAKEGKCVVWTFHDMNPFMGGFHYLEDRARNPQLKILDKWLQRCKEKAYSSISKKNLRVICLNHWMKSIFENSGVLKDVGVCIVPNSIDFQTMQRHEKHSARNKLLIGECEKVVLFGSQSLSNYRKGFDLLLLALEELKRKGVNFTLLTFGREDSKLLSGLGMRVISMGVISDPALLSIIYSAADLFVLPSREDNLPNVMLESWACGTPVVSFSNGGMVEYIKDGFNGILIDEISGTSLARGIKCALTDHQWLGRDIRSWAEREFSPSLISDRVIGEVYGTFKNC